jgi:hypothetical protein
VRTEFLAPTNFYRLLPVGLLATTLVLAFAATAQAIEWSGVPLIQHKVYQAVTGNGGSAYSGSFPIRLRGVVLNDNEDWLNPTSNYCQTAGHLWDMGGEAEIYVQAVDANDFGGTSCWIGQNYGNHIWHYSASSYATVSKPFNYTDGMTAGGWYPELDRLGFYRPGVANPDACVRAGDLVEIRAQTGLSYKGKMNVNEYHNNTPGVNLASPLFDFEIVILEKGYGLPEPKDIRLSDIKDSADSAIFDPLRASGGELYQSSLVTIHDVCLATTAGWGTNKDLVLNDGLGHTLDVHLGFDESFSITPAPTGYFDVTGILDQKSDSGKDGYRLLVMDAGSFVSVPEPGTCLSLLAAAAASLLASVFCSRRRSDG